MCPFNEFIERKTGHRHWYTAKRPLPVRRAGVPYFSPKTFNALKTEFAACDPHRTQIHP
jgi:hypothetical protein